jgi:hypothetical protein
MTELLEKTAMKSPPESRAIRADSSPSLLVSERRQTLDRRHRLVSLIEFYRWLSAVTLKIGGMGAIIILAMWWQKSPSRAALSHVVPQEAAYHWHGFHRVTFDPGN